MAIPVFQDGSVAILAFEDGRRTISTFLRDQRTLARPAGAMFPMWLQRVSCRTLLYGNGFAIFKSQNGSAAILGSQDGTFAILGSEDGYPGWQDGHPAPQMAISLC